jgi:hypothetical protein
MDNVSPIRRYRVAYQILDRDTGEPVTVHWFEDAYTAEDAVTQVAVWDQARPRGESEKRRWFKIAGVAPANADDGCGCRACKAEAKRRAGR